MVALHGATIAKPENSLTWYLSDSFANLLGKMVEEFLDLMASYHSLTRSKINYSERAMTHEHALGIRLITSLTNRNLRFHGLRAQSGFHRLQEPGHEWFT